MTWIGIITRFVVAAVILGIVWLIPGLVNLGTLGGILAAAVVIAALGYVVEGLLGGQVTARNRGIIGFIVTFVVIYLAQFVMPALLQVGLWGTLICAVVVGVLDVILPERIKAK
jgi:uncharacterized membrane protein YvlD (DUF360 family)